MKAENNVVKIDDHSIHGEVLAAIMKDLNEAVEKGEIRGLMIIWLDKDGYFNYQRSVLPSLTRAVGALETMKYNLMSE